MLTLEAQHHDHGLKLLRYEGKGKVVSWKPNASTRV